MSNEKSESGSDWRIVFDGNLFSITDGGKAAREELTLVGLVNFLLRFVVGQGHINDPRAVANATERIIAASEAAKKHYKERKQTSEEKTSSQAAFVLPGESGTGDAMGQDDFRLKL